MADRDDLPKDLNKLKVVELKDELDKRGLPIDGLKKDPSGLLKEDDTSGTDVRDALRLREMADCQLIDRLQRALDPELASNVEMPTDAQKALAEPLHKKEEEPIQPMLVETAQEESIDSAADVAMMAKADKTSKINDDAQDDTAATETTAVGHSMVEGSSEAAQEIDHAAAAKVTQEDVDMMPAALDEEVAAIVAKEEAKATLPPTPSPPPRASPLPSTPPLPEHGLDLASPSAGAENENRKRSASRSVSPEKRRRLASPEKKDAAEESYPTGPTNVLYITELRRPLMLPSLHEHLFTTSTPACTTSPSPFPASSTRPFTDPDCPGLWLGPIKDHAFAAYASIDAATDAKARIEGQVWPEDTGAALVVQYMPEQAVDRVVSMEQAAWKAGRQRLSVRIVGDMEDEHRIQIEVLDQKGEPYVIPPAPIDAPSGPKGRQPFRQPLARPPGGMGMPRAPPPGHQQGFMSREMGPMGGMQGGMGAPGQMGGGQGQRGMNVNINIRGRGPGGGDSYVPGRDGANPPPGARGPGPALGRGGDARYGGDGRLGRPGMRTRTRPELSWREGPGATESRA